MLHWGIPFFSWELTIWDFIWARISVNVGRLSKGRICWFGVIQFLASKWRSIPALPHATALRGSIFWWCSVLGGNGFQRARTCHRKRVIFPILCKTSLLILVRGCFMNLRWYCWRLLRFVRIAANFWVSDYSQKGGNKFVSIQFLIFCRFMLFWCWMP